jgi:GLPGLI family protein
MTFKKIVVCFFVLLTVRGWSQITAGKISYERKTNLYKKFKGNAKDWIREEDRNKIDYFELYFNDTSSVFMPVESDLKEYMGWATSKNTVYQNFNTRQKYLLKTIWGEVLHFKDSLSLRKWKITDSKRNIAGYNCRKAVWEANDTTRIYAWFTQELPTSTGPETFNGLPGVILGLATEDGGVVYFAKKVELIKPDPATLVPAKTKSKIYTGKELRAKIEKDYGKEKWGKAMIHENFDIW